MTAEHPRTSKRPSGAAMFMMLTAVSVAAVLLASGCSGPTATAPAAAPSANAPAVVVTGTNEETTTAAPTESEQAAPATGAVAPATGSVGAATGVTPAGAVPITPAPPPGMAGPTPESTVVPGTHIVGVVRDAAGQPLVDVTVVITKGPGALPGMAIFTDAFGRYDWPVTAAGTYALEASRDGYTEQTAEVTVGEGETAQADFQLTEQ